jgi:hypothetical protein
VAWADDTLTTGLTWNDLSASVLGRSLIMGHLVRVALLLCAVGVASSTGVAAQVVTSGELSGEIRVFPDGPGLVGQDSTAVQPGFTAEVKVEASGLLNRLNLTFNPYYRYDKVDRGRSIFDMHALKVAAGGERWHVKAGYDVEFWGVMEVVNPVNVINQTDVTEDFLGKRKLGQPMVDVTILGKWGTVDVYALEGFQPMRFPTLPGRLTAALPIHQDDAKYGSRNGRSQPEGAVRYFRNIRNVYVGASQFYGYAREPEMLVAFDNRATPFLVPSYNLEQQTGLELQVTFGNLILKSEDVLRLDAHGNHSSEGISVGGEYDVGARMNTGRNINIFGEYYYDDRLKSLIIPFTNDVFAGVRVGVNDLRSMEIRVWSNYDLAARRCDAIMLDASARISERAKAVVAYRGIVAGKGAFASVADDSHVVMKVEVFF